MAELKEIEVKADVLIAEETWDMFSDMFEVLGLCFEGMAQKAREAAEVCAEMAERAAVLDADALPPDAEG